MNSDICIAVLIKCTDFCDVMPHTVDWQAWTIVLEEHIASILRAELFPYPEN